MWRHKVFVFERNYPASAKSLPRLERLSDLDGRMFLGSDETEAWREKLRARLEDHGFELKSKGRITGLTRYHRHLENRRPDLAHPKARAALS